MRSSIAGLHILAVEDESLVAMWLEDLLCDLGCIVVGPASTVEQALTLVDSHRIDAAVLDINIAGKNVFPVADRLLELGIPYLFATGYGAAGLVDQHRARLVLQKPYALASLQHALSAVVA